MRNFIVTFVDGLRGDLPDFDRLSPQLPSDLSLERDLETLRDLVKEGRNISSWRTTHLQPEPATASLLTGKYPREHGIFGSSESLGVNQKTLVECFAEKGFKTILMNGHESYYQSGLSSRFDDTIMGPPQKLFARIKSLNDEGTSVFAFYEPLDLREPYLLSKFPPTEDFHDAVLQEVNKLSKALNLDQKYTKEDAQLFTSDWEIPQAGSPDLPVWQTMIKMIHQHYNNHSPLEKPVDHLVRYYLNTIELLSEHHFKNLKAFIDNEDYGESTSLFLTSNSAHGFTERNQEQTFGRRKKPIEDAVRVPALFLNIDGKLDFDRELNSHVDLFPTICDEFDLEVGEGVSGRSLQRGESEHDQIFVESSKTFSHDENEKNDEEGEASFPRSIISWSAVVDPGGWKLYRRGLPVTEADLELPLKKFIWTVMAKVTLNSLPDEKLSERVESFRPNDEPEARKQLWSQLKKDSDSEYELYNWIEDYHEEDGLLGDNSSESDEVIGKLIQVLEERFDDPYSIFEDIEGTNEDPDEVNLLAPMEAVGYVE